MLVVPILPTGEVGKVELIIEPFLPVGTSDCEFRFKGEILL
jgi:hypothetical protein